MPQFSVIFPAAGASVRFGQNKLTSDLAGLPVIVRSINAFLFREDVCELVIATRDRKSLEAAIGRVDHATILTSPKLRWCGGGESRAHTVALAAGATDVEWIAIHDAARPLVSQDLIDRTFAAALSTGAAAPALPMHLTVKEAQGPLPATIIRTVARDKLWAMQTPQCMRRVDLLCSIAAGDIPLDRITDDVQLLEIARKPATLVPGDEQNIKITTPLDLELAQLILTRSH